MTAPTKQAPLDPALVKLALLPATPSQSGLAHAFGITFAWVLGLTVLSFVPALLLPGRDQKRET